ncbi:hypothetical protein [Moorena producens]|uniref:hypothetical protein n=1 Tax=Moorena producens TaxID=1155739 RepID=UPI001313E8F0|nr:hypothetical protein [Moorena producens]
MFHTHDLIIQGGSFKGMPGLDQPKKIVFWVDCMKSSLLVVIVNFYEFRNSRSQIELLTNIFPKLSGISQYPRGYFCSLFRSSLFPTPDSRLPTPNSRHPTPYSLFP